MYFEIVTTLALIVGLVAVNLVKPGLGVNLAVATTETGIDVAAKPTLAGTLEHIVPVSFFDAAARNEALQIVFFAIMFAVALSQVPPHHKKLMLGFCESLSEVMLKFVGYVMKFAPVGIGAAMAVTVGRNGLGVLKNLGALVFTLYGALVVFALVVLLPIAILFKVPLRRFWQTIKEPFLVAFTTASSEAALPARSRTWRSSACRSASSPSCCPPATPSAWTAPRSTWRWHRSSWHRPPGFICRLSSRS